MTSAASAGSRPPRRPRTALASLLAVALGMEAVVMFFVTLTAFGLRAVPTPVAFGGGAALLVLLVLAAGATRFAWGRWLGWVLQAVLIATGVILPVMYFIGAGFAAIWVFCFVKGRQLDAGAGARTPPTQGEPS